MRQSRRVSKIRSYMFLAAIVSALAVSFGFRPRPEQAERGAPDNPAARNEWFRSQRAYPLNHIPSGARVNALHEVNAKLQNEAETIGVQGPLAGTSWALMGPKPTNTGYSYPTVSGRVSALAVDPTSSSTVYLGAAEGGVWKSTNGGSSWSPMTDNQVTLSTGSIAVAPSNHQIVYVGTGEANFSADEYSGEGILKSTNSGSSWTLTTGPFSGMNIGALAVQPSNYNTVLAATSQGVYRSTDGGSTWTKVLSGGEATGVVFNPSNGNTAYAALGTINGGSANGVYVSTNGGSTWSKDSSGLPTSSVGRIALAIAPSSTSTLFAGIANSSNGSLLGLYKTTNGAATWTKQSSIPDYCTPQCWYDNVVAVDPVNANVVFAGGSADNGTLFQSLNGGSSWSNVSVGYNFVELHEDHHALAFSANGATLYAGNDGGAWSSSNPSSKTIDWTNLNGTLAITQFYPGISVPTSSLVYGGSQDNGVQQYSGGLAWNYGWCGDAGFTAVDFKNTNNVYANCSGTDVEKSIAGGILGSWYPMTSGISTSDRMSYIPPLVMDPGNSSTLYFGTYRVYQTTNGASSWQAISSDLTSGSGDLSAIAVAPTNNKVVYAGTTNGKVQMTSNAGSGASWKSVDSGLPKLAITQIAVSPTSYSTAYVTFSGFAGSGQHVYQTTNSGSSWTDISKDLPNSPVNAIAIDPSYSNTLYVGTDSGVFYTTNGGTTWTTLLSGLPNVAVLGLNIYKPTRTLWAGTHGRAMWSISLSSIQ